MSTVYQSSIRFNPQHNRLSIGREGSTMSYRYEGHGGPVAISVADSVNDPILRGYAGKTTDLGKLQQELQAVVAPHADKARAASRWGTVLGGVGMATAAGCALAGVGMLAVGCAAAVGIVAFVAGQKAAQSILAPVRNCIDLGWSIHPMKAANQPGAFMQTSFEQHAANPQFLQR